MDTDPLIGNETVTLFTLDPNYACTLFKSCEKVSLIAQASLQSSMAFLDFMGFNGKQQSHSVIKFAFSKEVNKTLDTYVYPCNYPVPDNHTINNFTVKANCSAFCDSACPAPSVDGTINFFDGFDGILVAIVYGALVLFSIVYNLVRYFFFNKRGDISEEEEPFNTDENNQQNVIAGGMKKGPKDNNINNSQLSSQYSVIAPITGPTKNE